MASVKNLKKDINYVLGDVIEACYTYELLNDKADTKKSAAIIDEAIALFDSLMDKVNQSKVENKKAHYNAIKTELESAAQELLDKLNKL